jgi:hypothetical protein
MYSFIPTPPDNTPFIPGPDSGAFGTRYLLDNNGYFCIIALYFFIFISDISGQGQIIDISGPYTYAAELLGLEGLRHSPAL